MQTEPADQRQSRTVLSQGAADASQVENLHHLSSVKARPPLLLPLVFVSGIAVMATQMTASRLVQPFFGSSLLIWSNLIGHTMICLALGYFIGGRLGDRYPHSRFLYRLTGAAALAMALIPFVANPVLSLTGTIFQGVPGDIFFGSLVGIMLLFTLPLTLLGCVSPFAIRLLLKNVQGAGRTAGKVSSLSTVGSIIGTFFPVLWIIPTVGTRATVLIFAAILLAVSLAGYFLAGRDQSEVAATSVNPGRDLSEEAPASASAGPVPLAAATPPLLLPIILVCGMAVMATEMLASRLIQPYFGDSLLIWASLIGFIIIYLSVGYYLGGRLADRFPRPGFLYQLTGLAALSIGLIPVLSTPILGLAGSAFKNVNGGLFFGSLFGIILLFAAPVILLGCVSPFAVRLLVNNIQGAGRTAGKVSSISTVGSILGSFLPVLVFIPAFGTRNTLFIFSLVLLAFSTTGLWLVNRSRAPLYAVLLASVLFMAVFVSFRIKSAPYGELLYEGESAYNYIQVVKRTEADERNGRIDLVLNEGRAVHSIYYPNPNIVLTGGPWDYYMVTPFFSKNVTEKNVKNMMMIGLGAGTVPKQLTKAYGSQIQIEGIEIDPAIIEAGRKYFDMTEPNLNAVAQDGRFGLVASHKKFDIIGVDAYKQPYIPFHLTTKEFFQQVRNRLTPTGVAVINAGTPAVNGKIDYRLAEALAHTMKQVYPNVYMINLYNISGFFNTIVVATNQPSDLATFQTNIEQVVTNGLVKQVGGRALEKGSIREWTGQGEGPLPPVFTDDWAPVERIIDQVIIDYVTGGGK